MLRLTPLFAPSLRSGIGGGAQIVERTILAATLGTRHAADPKSAESFVRLGYAYGAAKMLAAEDAFKQALALNPTKRRTARLQQLLPPGRSRNRCDARAFAGARAIHHQYTPNRRDLLARRGNEKAIAISSRSPGRTLELALVLARSENNHEVAPRSAKCRQQTILLE